MPGNSTSITKVVSLPHLDFDEILHSKWAMGFELLMFLECALIYLSALKRLNAISKLEGGSLLSAHTGLVNV